MQKTKQLKTGIWLEGTYLSYQQVILFLYYWSEKYSSIKFCERELRIGHATTVYFCSRSLCTVFFLRIRKKWWKRQYIQNLRKFFGKTKAWPRQNDCLWNHNARTWLVEITSSHRISKQNLSHQIDNFERITKKPVQMVFLTSWVALWGFCCTRMTSSVIKNYFIYDFFCKVKGG